MTPDEFARHLAREDADIREGMRADRLTVAGTYGGPVRLAHGNDCVAVQVESQGAVVLTPDEARLLARSIERQADHAEAAANESRCRFCGAIEGVTSHAGGCQ